MKDDSKIIIALAAGLSGAVLSIFSPRKKMPKGGQLSESLQNLGISVKEIAAAEIDRLTGLNSK